MYFTIYQITNKTNNKIYIGKHQTIDSTRILKNDIIPDGWYKGRS